MSTSRTTSVRGAAAGGGCAAAEAAEQGLCAHRHQVQGRHQGQGEPLCVLCITVALQIRHSTPCSQGLVLDNVSSALDI